VPVMADYSAIGVEFNLKRGSETRRLLQKLKNIRTGVWESSAWQK
jgi:hypothetical protein